MQAWLTRSAYGGVKEQTSQFEKGSYHVFDPIQWRKIPKEMTLEYKELEQRPTPPTSDMKVPNLRNETPMTPSGYKTFDSSTTWPQQSKSNNSQTQTPLKDHANL